MIHFYTLRIFKLTYMCYKIKKIEDIDLNETLNSIHDEMNE